MEYTIVSDTQVYSPDEQFVWGKLWEYNRSKVPADHQPSEIFNRICKDEQGRVLAGIFCESFFHYMYVKLLWVDASLRGHGLGSRLLDEAEQHARLRGCTHIYLDTFSFQAADYYPQHGFREFGSLDEYPPGHKRHFFVKSLGAAASAN